MDATMDERSMKLAKLREQDGGLEGRQDQLGGALSRVAQHLEQLEAKLRPVLMEQESGQALHGQPRAPMSPLAGFLAGATGHAENLAERIGDLLQRVDL